MKFVLMVAAGMAVGLTVAVAVLVQVLERLAPLLVTLALVALVLHLVRRRGGGQNRHSDQAFPLPAMPPAVAPPAVGPAMPRVAGDLQAPYLRWGPSADQDLDARLLTYVAGTRLRRARAGAHPSRPVRGRRP